MKAQVLLPKVFNFPFTYNSIPETKIGDLVEVPFGSKKEIGVIWKNNYSEPKNIKFKKIKRKIGYSIDKKLVNFIEWFSSYNMVPIGLVLKMVIGRSDQFIKIKDDLNFNYSVNTSNKFFYDVIYSPTETNFLKKAKAYGNRTENGKMMFIYQAHQAFTIWHKLMPKIDDDVIKLVK